MKRNRFIRLLAPALREREGRGGEKAARSAASLPVPNDLNISHIFGKLSRLRQRSASGKSEQKRDDIFPQKSGKISSRYCESSPTADRARHCLSTASYPAPAPCRSGCRGEAPCSLRKERNPGSRNLYTAFITIESAGSTCPYHFPSSSPPLPGIKSVFLACRFC